MTLAATLFWGISMPIEHHHIISREARAHSGRIRIENLDALYGGWDEQQDSKLDESGRLIFPHVTPNDPPRGMVKLHITLPGFAPDFLHEGVFLVSADWRSAARLSEAEVIYLPVDASTSLPEVQAKDYKVLWPVAVRDWIDLERAGIREYPPESGIRTAERPFFRTDIEVDVDIFYTPHFRDPFVTEALAARLTDAGIEMEFLDYTWGGYTGDLMDLPPGTRPPRRGD